jgi:hypothetical protein
LFAVLPLLELYIEMVRKMEMVRDMEMGKEMERG